MLCDWVLPPTCAVSGIVPEGVRVSVGQFEHTAEIVPLMPNMVGVLLTVYVIVLAEETILALKGRGNGAGREEVDGNAIVDVRDPVRPSTDTPQPPRLSVSLPELLTVTVEFAPVQVKVSGNKEVRKLMLRGLYVIAVGLYVTPAGLRLVFA